MFRGALKGHVDAADMWSSNNENLQPCSAMMHGLAARGHIPSLFPGQPGGLSPEYGGNSGPGQRIHFRLPAGQADPERRGRQHLPCSGNRNRRAEEDTPADAGTVPPWMTPSGRERQAPAPKTINPEAVKFWEQAVELGNSTGPGRAGQLL